MSKIIKTIKYTCAWLPDLNWPSQVSNVSEFGALNSSDFTFLADVTAQNYQLFKTLLMQPVIVIALPPLRS